MKSHSYRQPDGSTLLSGGCARTRTMELLRVKQIYARTVELNRHLQMRRHTSSNAVFPGSMETVCLGLFPLGLFPRMAFCRSVLD
jgi:hypothetical protein